MEALFLFSPLGLFSRIYSSPIMAVCLYLLYSSRRLNEEATANAIMSKPLHTLAVLGTLRFLLFVFNVFFWVSEKTDPLIFD